jgi:hypothetical protein
MKLSPEMIDSAVIQLRGVFAHGEDIPKNVKDAAMPFLEALDNWSEDLKAGKNGNSANSSAA